MDFMKEYQKWCTDPYFDNETKAELEAIKDDKAEIEDRFYRTLEFGTGGYGSSGTPLHAIAFTMTGKKSDGHRYYLALETYATIKTPRT